MCFGSVCIPPSELTGILGRVVFKGLVKRDCESKEGEAQGSKVSRQLLWSTVLEFVQEGGPMEKGEFGTIVLCEDGVQLIPGRLGEMEGVVDVGVGGSELLERSARWVLAALPGLWRAITEGSVVVGGFTGPLHGVWVGVLVRVWPCASFVALDALGTGSLNLAGVGPTAHLAATTTMAGEASAGLWCIRGTLVLVLVLVAGAAVREKGGMWRSRG